MTDFATTTDLRRTLVSAVAALLFSATCVAAAVGPAQAATPAVIAPAR